MLGRVLSNVSRVALRCSVKPPTVMAENWKMYGPSAPSKPLRKVVTARGPDWTLVFCQWTGNGNGDAKVGRGTPSRWKRYWKPTMSVEAVARVSGVPELT